MNPNFTAPRRASGFSLIEMMLAMLIGLIIMAGVMQVFVSTRDTQRSSEDQLALLGDARFAIETIAYDLRHTSLWGRHNNSGTIACQKDNPNANGCPAGAEMPVAAADCGAYEYINLVRPLFATNNVNPYASTCVNQAYKANTDVLSLRYADTAKIADEVLAAGIAYVRTTSTIGMLFNGPDFPASFYNELKDNADPLKRKYSNHMMVSRVYYVSDYTDKSGDGRPSLRRVDLAQGPSMKSEVLLPNVEDFQLEFGVDLGTNGAPGTEKDGQVDSYVNADNVSDWQYGEVLAVRVWLLMRSDREDRDNIGGTQQFTIAGVQTPVFNDGYRRYLVSSVIKLRNMFQADIKKAGS